MSDNQVMSRLLLNQIQIILEEDNQSSFQKAITNLEHS